MRLKQTGPPGFGTGATPEYCSQPKFYRTTSRNANGIDAERQLVAAGWFDPVQLAELADALGLHADDFLDRLHGFIVGYCRWCAEQNRLPGLCECTELAARIGILTSIDEIYDLLRRPVSPGDTLTDVICDTQRAARDFAEELCRELTRDALRAVKHAFECPRCIACACGAAPTVTRYGTVWSTPSATGKAAACA